MRHGKRALVTGGAGFLGSHLCRRLIDDGFDVLCVDNLFTGSRNNLTSLLGNANFEFMRHDICFPLYVEIDYIFNLACPASPKAYQHDPVQTLKTSILGAINMLGLAKRTGAKIFQASTSEIYGDPLISPQTEEYWGNVNICGPRSCYDEGKRAAETAFHDYNRQHNVDIRVGRIFNTYGPQMNRDDGRVVSNFIVQALKNENITIYGDGSQTRSFCYVDDLVEAIVRYGCSPSVSDTVLNLGNPHEIAIEALAQLVLEKIPESTSQLIFSDLPTDDPRQRRPNIDKASSSLSWVPKVSLEDGIQETIDYFRACKDL